MDRYRRRLRGVRPDPDVTLTTGEEGPLPEIATDGGEEVLEPVIVGGGRDLLRP